ncbi:sensor domain-containing protein [Chitinimonas sp. BJB300]|uniref:sensor domain-containing protein n=1 Tax=Chitinimonas sp. BJB300 TaxID=1559339 RepID=UPI000C0F939B|nr:EAL domain-containing protein [Chitinimonas sp. BJB300]PHV12780.1 bifunctional diguanylate cyclase/phosphodiesterase [Chitinimonas sp. BJB300]TSJ91351.1 EAL domain-containing protein [Chitinimonas sp. BJB300]
MPALLNHTDEQLFRRIVEDAEEGIWLVDNTSHTRYLNARMAQILGGQAEDIMNRPIWDFIYDDEIPVVQRHLERRRQGKHETYDLRFRRLDGEEIWTQMCTAPLWDAEDSYEGEIAFVRDISWRREAEQRFAESERANQAVFEHSGTIKLIIDPKDGRIVAANAAACAFYGYDAETFSQLNINQINTLSPEEIQTQLTRTTEEETFYFQFRHRLKSGEIRDVEIQSSAIDQAGRTLLHSIVHDITPQKSAEHWLRITQYSVEQARIAVVWINAAGKINYANRYACELVNCPHTQLINEPIWHFNLGISELNWPNLWESIKTTGALRQRSEVLRIPSTLIDIEVHASYLNFEGEEFMVSYTLDISEQVQAEGMLNMQHDALEAVAAGYNISHLLKLLAQRMEILTKDAFCSILLLEGDQLFTGAAPSLPESYNQAINGLRIGPTIGSCGTAAYFDRSIEVCDIATDPLWENFKDLALQHGLAACWSTPIHASDGRVLGTFALYFREKRGPSDYHRRVVSACTHLAGIAIEHRAAEARVHTLAFYDSLTGLPNRTLFADRVELALARAQRDATQLALLFIDLDRFKTINDSLGHAIGDRLLRTIAKRLAVLVRDSDTVCRLGGDEFVLLLPECDMSGAATIAEKLIISAAERVEFDGFVLNPSASIGISLYPSDGEDYDTLLKNADTAMYRAKEGGRNAYCFYHYEMNQNASARLKMEAGLRVALARNELLLHYQPQVYIDGGRLHGLEALVRWHHPQWGMVSPAEFIPVAEECGMIDEIGTWVLDEACHQMAEWQKQGIAIPRIAVNLSVRQFRHDNVYQRVVETLDRHSLKPNHLTLEITESLMMQRDDDTLNVLRALDSMGITLAVDDFGTGYSSLGYLKRFPVSELKLDQSFVRDLSEDQDDRALASAVIRIGQSLRLKVVAEGVETAEQLAFLQGEGCDIAQGYHFAKPMSAAALVIWVQEWEKRLP